MAFKNRVVAITGAASGIGLVLAHYLLSHGAKISLADSNRAALHHAVLDLEAKHPGTASRVQPFELDIRKPASLEAWMQAIITKFGRLDGAANLAGITGTPPAHPVRECDGDDWDLILAVNLTGTKNCVKAQLAVMKEGASIVNTASVSALKAVPNAAAYAVSKAGVISLTKTVAAEEGKRGIRVNCIAPYVFFRLFSCQRLPLNFPVG